MDTVTRLQRDLNDMRAESRYLRTPGIRDSLRPSRQVTFTLTNVPKFAGATSWEQYQQVSNAIVLSNGWDDTTTALQLLSHLEGNTLNITLLVPASRRASRVGLVVVVCWSLTSLRHSNGHIETMPAREINPFTALTRIRSQFLRTQ